MRTTVSIVLCLFALVFLTEAASVNVPMQSKQDISAAVERMKDVTASLKDTANAKVEIVDDNIVRVVTKPSGSLDLKNLKLSVDKNTNGVHLDKNYGKLVTKEQLERLKKMSK